jgi:hypothetical protein
MRDDSTGGRGQISKGLRRSSGRTTFSYAQAELTVEEFAEKRRQGRGLGKSKFSQVWEEIVQAPGEQQPSSDRQERTDLDR